MYADGRAGRSCARSNYGQRSTGRSLERSAPPPNPRGPGPARLKAVSSEFRSKLLPARVSSSNGYSIFHDSPTAPAGGFVYPCGRVGCRCRRTAGQSQREEDDAMRPNPACLLLAAVAAVGLAQAVARQAAATDFPSQTVKIIVPNPAGGTADALPRIVGDALSKLWKQAVVVENRAGAA